MNPNNLGCDPCPSLAKKGRQLKSFWFGVKGVVLRATKRLDTSIQDTSLEIALRI